MRDYQIRIGTIEDLSFLKEMLYEAVFWNQEHTTTPLEELFKEPEIAKILQGWSERVGDFSLIAIDNNNKPLGAVWYRFWTADNHSFGFIDETIPEIGIGIIREIRGNGLGTELMNKIMNYAKEAGIKQVSLSVDPNNYARIIYEKLGFSRIGAMDTSWTMVTTL